MELVIQYDGDVRMIYAESIDPHAIGRPTIIRGSHVEPNAQGQWMADLSPVSGPLLGPFATRTAALRAEVAWLHENWLVPHSG